MLHRDSCLPACQRVTGHRLLTGGPRPFIAAAKFEKGPEKTVKPPPSPLLGEGKIPPRRRPPLVAGRLTRIATETE